MNGEMNGESSAKPKRGRKPKVAASKSDPEVEVTPVTGDEQVVLTSPPGDEASPTKQVKPRRGRKPKAVYNYDNTNPDMVCNNSDDENIIMKLNIASKEIDEMSTTHTEEMTSLPDAYNELNHDTFHSKPCEIEYECQQTIETREHEHKNLDKLKVIELLKDFEEKNKNNEWPQTTSISCYWCCNSFETPPFGIPVKFIDGKFHVFGCFCSLECAAAYNMDSHESLDEIFERHNLINLLSRKIGYKDHVKCAPNRLSLKMFGGHLELSEFRSYTDANKLININFPPMMTLTQQIEEINESDITSEYKYIPIDTERINKYKEKIKMRRTKPLMNFENTLDHAMNLKFGA
jgi:hypothetical protein